MLMLEGRGIAQDYDGAKALLREAADLGYEPATRNLARLDEAEQAD